MHTIRLTLTSEAAISVALALFLPLLLTPSATGQTCAPVPAGLVSWWTLGGSGIDKKGDNPAGIFGGQFIPGEVGTSLMIDSVDDYGRVGAAPSLNVGVGAGFTIDMWINPTDTTIEHPLTEWNTGSGFQSHFWISVPAPPDGSGTGPGSLFANIISPDGTYHIYSSDPGLVLPNVWQHVALTYSKSSGTSVLYLNGVAMEQHDVGSFTPLTTADLYFGLRPSDGEFYEGQLDEIDLFNRALSGREIQSIFAAGGAGKCSSLLLPVSLDFGSQAVNTASTVQTVTFTNQKTTALAILSITASGPFEETDTCGAILAPGRTCSIGVTFKPLAAGTQTGLVIIIDGASDGPLTAGLIGTGT
jgi:hypothetical protein